MCGRPRYNSGVGTSGDSLLERLRRRTDWRLTAQRRVIAEAFEGEHVHLTAEEILARSRRRMPEISLATVYNALNELVALGELRPVHAGGGRPRYDPTSRPHDHLVCLACGTIHDVFARGRVELPRSQRFGHRVVAQETVFKGYCPDCQEKRAR
jgi:Fur family transcriptional regulator, stress-responsive regulator